jgi:hypothetical protein
MVNKLFHLPDIPNPTYTPFNICNHLSYRSIAVFGVLFLVISCFSASYIFADSWYVDSPTKFCLIGEGWWFFGKYSCLIGSISLSNNWQLWSTSQKTIDNCLYRYWDKQEPGRWEWDKKAEKCYRVYDRFAWKAKEHNNPDNGLDFFLAMGRQELAYYEDHHIQTETELSKQLVVVEKQQRLIDLENVSNGYIKDQETVIKSFEYFDKNHDGVITPDEYDSIKNELVLRMCEKQKLWVWERLGKTINRRGLPLFCELDLDDNGEITLTEFGWRMSHPFLADINISPNIKNYLPQSARQGFHYFRKNYLPQGF